MRSRRIRKVKPSSRGDRRASHRNLVYGAGHQTPQELGLIADKPVGFALFFSNYSTFLGRPGIYLEDLLSPPRREAKASVNRCSERLLPSRLNAKRRLSGRSSIRPAGDPFIDALGPILNPTGPRFASTERLCRRLEKTRRILNLK